MPNKDKNIPKRRFKEFENADAWELRKFGEVVYRSNLISSSKDLPRLEFEDINSGLGTLNKDISQKLDYRKGLEFNVGDVLFGKLRPYLKNWWYAEFKGIALGDFWNLKSDLWHSCFLYTYIQSNSFQLVANDTSGTKMPRSDWNLVAESIAKFPSLSEQEAIGTFFSTLDQHITLHQRKLDKLKSVKQAYLSEMFPAEGERVPKRRFPGFTDAWELQNVGEICRISTGKSNTQDREEQGKFPFYVRSPIIEKSTKYLFDEEAVLTVGDGVGTGKVFHYVHGKYDLHQRVYRMFSFTHVNAKYFYYYFSKKFFDRVMAMTAKNSVDSVRLEMISDMEITIPQLEEQEKIVKILSTLDQQITLHQRKLEKLKNLKKALLNELFV
ncbi:restriction endonuclease subunit S [Streptococcus suis]|nr:restriction endonuclease subunit S [Streptococcus suis]